MNDSAPPAAEQEDHIAYEGERQLWDTIKDCNWNSLENILNSNLITLEQKHDLIKYSSADVEEDNVKSDDSDAEPKFSNSFSQKKSSSWTVTPVM